MTIVAAGAPPIDFEPSGLTIKGLTILAWPGDARARATGRAVAQASNAFRAISSVVLQSLHQQGLDAASIRLLRVELARLSCCLLVGKEDKEVSLLLLSCVKVYLGDSHELAVTGAGARYTCRERVQSRCEADVLVDFHAPILQRLRLWALDFAVLAATSQDDPFPTFCFETSCPERFQNVAHLMRDTAQVVDQVSAVRIQKSMGQPLPRLIHYPSTAETVNAAYALARLEKYGCDPTQTLVLCERDWGAKQVRELNAGFQVLSAADVIDDLLREDPPDLASILVFGTTSILQARKVRQWARHGFSGHEIQSELDRRDAVTLRGLDTGGKKFTLVERLSAALKAEERNRTAFEQEPQESEAICDPYLDPYFFGTQEASSDQKMHRRSRSRSPRATGPLSSEKVRAQGLRRLAEDICGVGLQASLASLDAAVAAGSVSSKLLTELEAKLSTCITMIEMQQK
ncbi:unnamed protein product [Symbiodinium sp. CCMP2592]|nr:unnamed protein product [Symbiodinium sp. CCMP2592]